MPSFADRIAFWNRRIHFYLGLYFLSFLWLFLFTGLLLNHGTWNFAEFWTNRIQTDAVRRIQSPPAGGDLSQARDIMNQLGLRGEIEWTESRTGAGQLVFRVSRPGHIFEIRADAGQQTATVRTIRLNNWGVARILHTFTGVRMTDHRNQRDWLLTTVWAYSMDALALGLIVMALGGVYVWWTQPLKRRLGAWALGLGVLACGYFVFGLRWFA